MKILVTGATGFIGSHFAALAAAKGHEVVGVFGARRPDRQEIVRRLESLGITMRQADVLGPGGLLPVLDGVDCVCHFAGAFRESGADDNYFHEINVTGTANALASAATAGVRRFVYCSTAGIFGQRVAGAITEHSDVHPFNAYEASKLAAEVLIRQRAPELAIEYVIVRPASVYGPGDVRLLKMFKAAAKGRFPLFGRGEGRRHMIYVTDLAEAFLLACTVPGAASGEFNIAGPRVTRLREILDSLAKVVGRKATGPRLPLAPMMYAAAITEFACGKLGVDPPIYRRRMDFYVNDAEFDCRAANHALGWQAQVELDEGLKRTYGAYCAAGWI
ncbi:MAG: NAD(P)-dependent oxidoreductase [Steroidobacteraceae bacterium]